MYSRIPFFRSDLSSGLVSPMIQGRQAKLERVFAGSAQSKNFRWRSLICGYFSFKIWELMDEQ